ncbi:2OG-Fe(II) oxygenase superfamily protein [Xylariaceae sp. FL1651]|nr:2OG-Fe(II) oxygenase superfamily protein [Xylariaceae sp. FL1651]
MSDMPEAVSIPIIDIAGDEVDQDRIAKELVDAAVEYGFVYIKNTSQYLSLAQVEQIFNISRCLFESPLEDKQRCKIGKNNQGWSGMHTETLDPKTQRVGDFKEGFNFGTFTNGKATQHIPHSIEPHEAHIAAFREACHLLCRKLLLLFGIGLGVNQPDFFTAAHSLDKPSGSILRFLYYPPPSATPSVRDADVRAGAHSDYGSVTLLFRLKGQAGLEILTPTNTWAPVPVCPPGTENDPSPPILVNIGDLLSYWTNGLLRSTVHRVTFSGSGASNNTNAAGLADGESTTDPRYSIVYFCHPADETPLTAVPSQRVHNFEGRLGTTNIGNPYAERKVLTADEHLQMRLRATYLQIYGNDGDEKK